MASSSISQYGTGQYGTSQYGIGGIPVSDVDVKSYTDHQINIDFLIPSTGIPKVKNTFNQFDEHGLVTGLQRLSGEKNWEYKRRIMDVFINYANSSYRGLINGITRELGLFLYEPITINPKINSINNNFLATDPYIKFDETWLYLYSDYKNNILDYKIDRFTPGGNYEHLIRLSDFINQSTFFECSILSEFDFYTSSMTIINQSHRVLTSLMDIPVSTRFKLEHNRLVKGSFVFSNKDFFYIEVENESEVNETGKYWIDYNKGIVRVFTPASVGDSMRYEYTKYPFKPIASPVILHDINNENFRTKMFEQVLQDDGSYINGALTELGTDIINELLSVTPMYWGI